MKARITALFLLLLGRLNTHSYWFSLTWSSFGKVIEQRKFDWKSFFFLAGCALSLFLSLSLSAHSCSVPGLVFLCVNYCSFGHHSFSWYTIHVLDNNDATDNDVDNNEEMSTEMVLLCALHFQWNTHIFTTSTHTLWCHRNDVKMYTDKSLLLWCT